MLMEKQTQKPDDSLEQQLHDCSLDPTVFSHESHIRLAWIHISKYGLNKAIENITTDLKRYVSHLGAHEKYNETLTVAAVRIVGHFMENSNADKFDSFIHLNPRLKNDFKGLLSAHYSSKILNSAKAKLEYIKPDLLSF